MKRCVVDAATLKSPVDVYRELAAVFAFPDYFGNNPDALWDALSEYSGEPVEVVWRIFTASAERYGGEFNGIVAVLERAAAEGKLTFRLE